MDKIVLVGVGGAVGSILRYWVSGYVQDLSQSIGFPFGTLAVNLLGCLVIGILSQLGDDRGVFTPESRALIFIGVLGGFTTFSTFANESMNLFRDGENLPGIVNVAASLGLGLGAVVAGRALVSAVWR